MDGTFTNTQRLIKYHHKAVDPPGDARSDIWFTYHLGKRLKTLYEGSTEPRDQGLLNLVWDYEPDPEEVEAWQIKDEPSALKIMREINGYVSGKPDEHLPGFAALKDDGSTTCASWIYSGIYPKPGIENLKAASRVPDPEGGGSANLGWGFAWPANRRIIYNRASARPDGTPWSEEKAWVYWDPEKVNPATDEPGMWTGADVPDFAVAKAPDAEAEPGRYRARRPERHRPLHHEGGRQGLALHPDRSRRRPAADALRAGRVARDERPLSGAAELAGAEGLERRRQSPGRAGRPGLPLRPDHLPPDRAPPLRGDEPLAALAGRAAAGALRRDQPRAGGREGDRQHRGGAGDHPARRDHRQGAGHPPHAPDAVAGKTIHHVGLPWHWGYQGLVTGAVTNDLSLMVGDPNVTIHEGKAFVCNVEKA